MDRRLPQTIGLAVLTALLTIFVAQVDGAPVVREAAGRIAADSGARDSAVTIKWLNDANVLALVGVMNGRQIAASQIEAASAHSDSVRALAVSLAKEYAELSTLGGFTGWNASYCCGTLGAERSGLRGIPKADRLHDDGQRWRGARSRVSQRTGGEPQVDGELSRSVERRRPGARAAGMD